MDIARPHTAICPTLDSGVLAVLAGTNRPLTGREVARLMGRNSHSGVLEVLSRLAEHGLVHRQEAGRALLYTLNREHLAAPAVEVLASLRAELFSRLREAIQSWDVPPFHVSLFGSVARGEGDTESDIDVFIVRSATVSEDDESWRGQMDRLASDIFRWTGNRAGIAEVAETELDRLQQEQTPILADLKTDAVVLSGPEIVELLRARK